MPWSVKNPPRPAKNWSAAAKRICVRAANSTLKNGGSDTDAIRACIGAVKRGAPGSIKAPKKEWKGRKHDDVSALAFTTGFYALPRIELEDGAGRNVSTLQVLPQGKFKHPWYGDLDFTEKNLRAMQRNFDRKVLGVDIAVDENHDRSRALGWFKALKHRNKHEMNGVEYAGLFAEIEWTPEGRSLLERDIYRYFSAEVGSYTDNTEGKKTPNIVFGGGLTNRPFFKQMPAVSFGDGTADDRFHIGLFEDEYWSFSDVDEEEEQEEEHTTFYAGYSAETDEDVDQDEDEEEPEDGEEDMKYADLIAKLNKDFSLKLSADNEVEAAIDNAFGMASSLVNVREKFITAGFKFDENADIADVVLAGYNTLKTTNSENAEAIKSIRKELDDTKATTAVDKLVDSGKIAPAKREQYVKLYHTNNELFEEMTKDLEPVVLLGEIGGDGIPQPPGSNTMEKFLEPAKATEEADRYMNLVPVLEERLAAKRK